MKTTRRGLLGLFAGGAAAATGVGKAVASGGTLSAIDANLGKITGGTIRSEDIAARHIVVDHASGPDQTVRGFLRSRDGKTVIDFDTGEFRFYD